MVELHESGEDYLEAVLRLIRKGLILLRATFLQESLFVAQKERKIPRQPALEIALKQL